MFETRPNNMSEPERFRYAPEENEPLSIAVVSAIAQAHHEDVLQQNWILQNDINPEALDALFQDKHLGMALQFEADETTVRIESDERGNPTVEIESHR
jgi:hypothetical protein